jgi:DnaJ-class molecular chaperone
LKLELENARERVQTELDETNGAVSGGAIQRNATVIDSQTGSIQFTVTGKERRLSPTTRTLPPRKCTVCSGSPPETMAQSFKKSPFSRSFTYYVPDVDTHTRVVCSSCRGSGHVDCTDCGGTGAQDCGDCYGTGYRDVEERCEACGESEDSNCQVCGGTGTVEYRETCGGCDGTGRDVCSLCNGSGQIKCYHCDGSGDEHEYKAIEGEISRQFIPSGLPDSWSENHRKIANILNLACSEFTDHGRTYKIQTQEVKTCYLTYKYGDDTHRVMVTNSTHGLEVVWDPETSYPETSWRRKIGDLKSRLLW